FKDVVGSYQRGVGLSEREAGDLVLDVRIARSGEVADLEHVQSAVNADPVPARAAAREIFRASGAGPVDARAARAVVVHLAARSRLTGAVHAEQAALALAGVVAADAPVLVPTRRLTAPREVRRAVRGRRAARGRRLTGEGRGRLARVLHEPHLDGLLAAAQAVDHLVDAVGDLHVPLEGAGDVGLVAGDLRAPLVPRLLHGD